MSQIDPYPHKLIGILNCPAEFDFMYGNSTREIPLYRLEIDTPDGEFLNAKKGDLSLGGGGGEAPAMIFSMPETILFYLNENWGNQTKLNFFGDIIKHDWSLNQAYIFGTGYIKLGWQPDKTSLEHWLAEHLVSFLEKNYSKDYEGYFNKFGTLLEQNGKIFNPISL